MTALVAVHRIVKSMTIRAVFECVIERVARGIPIGLPDQCSVGYSVGWSEWCRGLFPRSSVRVQVEEWGRC